MQDAGPGHGLGDFGDDRRLCLVEVRKFCRDLPEGDGRGRGHGGGCGAGLSGMVDFREVTAKCRDQTWSRLRLRLC